MTAHPQLPFLGLLCLSLLCGVVPVGGEPNVQLSLDELLRRAGGYVTRHVSDASVVVCDEEYLQQVVGEEIMFAARDAAPRAVPVVLEQRRLHSEIVLVKNPDEDHIGYPWVEFRDVIKADGRPVRESEQRVAELFLQPARRPSVGRIAAESARFNIGPFYRNMNLPTVALLFLHPYNRHRSEFQKVGDERVSGFRAWIVRSTERLRPTLLRQESGEDAPVQGFFWIEPFGGQVLKTQLRTQSNGGPHVEVTVEYGANPRIRLWLPLKMQERLADQRVGVRVVCTATYSNCRRFETSARVRSPK